METTLLKFNRRLRETVTWCEWFDDRSEPMWGLRSNELMPPAKFDEGDPTMFWNERDYIDHVVRRRAKLLAEYSNASAVSSAPRGRLPLCGYEYTNHNYVSAESSCWFFDGYDNPPWDTWICGVNDYLVSWVPPQFVDLANEGMSVECSGMLAWVENSETEFKCGEPPAWLAKRALEPGLGLTLS